MKNFDLGYVFAHNSKSILPQSVSFSHAGTQIQDTVFISVQLRVIQSLVTNMIRTVKMVKLTSSSLVCGGKCDCDCDLIPQSDDGFTYYQTLPQILCFVFICLFVCFGTKANTFCEVQIIRLYNGSQLPELSPVWFIKSV